MRTLTTLSNYLIGIAVFALAVLPASAENTYPPEYQKEYLKDCMATSMTEGLGEPEAQKLCQCTLTEFQQRYSLAEFQELNVQAETDPKASNALIAVGELCFESILYEE